MAEHLNYFTEMFHITMETLQINLLKEKTTVNLS